MLVEDTKNATYKIKIGDFGISKIVKHGELMNESCGTPAYLAPEIIQCVFYDAFKVDMWCLGILLYIYIYLYILYKYLKGEYRVTQTFKNKGLSE